VVDDLVMYCDRIYISTSSPSLQDMLTSSHGMGHEGTQKTLHRLCHNFFIPGARIVVHDFVHACAVCQHNKTDHLHPVGLLHPLKVPSVLWADIVMDFIEGFPKVSGKLVILTVVDRFSKYMHFIPLSHPYTATTVARAFFTNIVRLHGLPSYVVSDHDPAFMSNFWRELFKLSRVTLHTSTAFHPQIDDQSEATNKIITMYLRCLTRDQPRQWVQWLPWADFCYNSAF
jgi:hypothetical protein